MAAKTDHILERLIFFSDAIFAIAITLLVLEIEVPHLPRGSAAAAFGPEISRLTPSLAGYAISFAVIGMFWVNHHRAFSCAERYRPAVLPWNMGLLGMIALMPWFTALMSSNIRSRLPWTVYCGALTVTAALNLVVVRLATGRRMAGEDRAGGPDAARVRQRSLAVLLGAATGVGLTFLLSANWHFSLLGIVFWRRILDVWLKARARKAALATAAD
jgi:uncharacterized membrane protein